MQLGSSESFCLCCGVWFEPSLGMKTRPKRLCGPGASLVAILAEGAHDKVISISYDYE